MKKIIVLSTLVICFSIFLCNLQTVNAANGSLMDRVSPACKNDGSCQLEDFEKIAVWVAEYIIGISGAVVLAYFVYGGFVYLTSSGSSEQVKKGTSILTNAAIGLFIIFISWSLVFFVAKSLGANMQENELKINIEAK